MKISPLNSRRLNNFKLNKRGWYSFWIFSFLFLISIFANFIANDKPLIIKYNNGWLLTLFSKKYKKPEFVFDLFIFNLFF